MNHITVTEVQCRHCGTSFSLPDLPPERRIEVASLVRAGNLLPAAATLEISTWKPRKHTGPLRPGDAVNVIKHLTRADLCHSCKTPINTLGLSECPNCQAANIHW